MQRGVSQKVSNQLHVRPNCFHVAGWWLFDDGRTFALQSRAEWQQWFRRTGFEMAHGGMQPDLGSSSSLAVENQTVFALQARLLIGKIEKSRKLSSANLPLTITGGLGGIGLATMDWLLYSHSVSSILLTSRSGLVKDSLDAQRLRISKTTSCARILTLASDIADLEHCRAMFSQHPASGVVHSVGVLSDALVKNQQASSFKYVVAPKVDGVHHLHQVAQLCPPEYFVVYSSGAGLLGSLGQSTHAAANTSLDSFVEWRRSTGLQALAIQWGAWSQIGYAARVGAAAKSDNRDYTQSFSPNLGLKALRTIWESSGIFAVVPITGDLSSVLQDTCSLIQGTLPSLAFTGRPVSAVCSAELPLQCSSSNQHFSEHALTEIIRVQFQKVAGFEIGSDSSFTESGMDSLAAIELRSTLQSQLQLDLPANIITTFPTPALMAASFATQATCVRDIGLSVSLLPQSEKPYSRVNGKPVLMGSACRMGGELNCVSTMWSTLCEQRSCLIQARGGHRWAVLLQAALGSDIVQTNCGIFTAAFIGDIDSFDSAYFKADAWASSADPTHRLLTEVMMEALTDAGYAHKDPRLRGSAVITSVTSTDYSSSSSPQYEVMAARHISQLLLLEGQYQNVNTICSSTHVAIHKACQILQEQRVPAALLGASLLLLNPQTSLAAATMGILSPSGKARPFCKLADGLARGTCVLP